MSRAAAATATKGAQKAAMKDKQATREADLAMGLTSTMKKLMSEDTLMCMLCKATALGPGKCECVGGRTKPAADYDAKVELLAAAQAREALRKDAVRGASAAQQASVQAAKAKGKAGRDAEAADLDLSTMDTCEVVFEPGKLGMSIEKNAVVSVTEGGAAANLQVAAGWVIRMVNGQDVPADKAAIMKLAAAAMKVGPLTLTFQWPMEAGQHHCSSCDKFVDGAQFDGVTNGLEAGPGKQVCYPCEEYADMFG